MGNNPSVEQVLSNPIGAIANAVQEENRRKEQERLAREEQERQIRQRILEEAENRNRIERENIIFRATISNKMNELINKLNTFRTRVNELNEIEITNRFNK